ncbi:MAG: molybdopterin-guanine dinucleotide biosynthesis protein B [Spirochaetales bacterium]|nr:molybdopterin-guanine dinucleotide biosynthesis protein B [Spirochaetales bacterium]
MKKATRPPSPARATVSGVGTGKLASPSRRALVGCLLGWSDSGKTALAESTLRLLTHRGVPCAALKVTKHPGDRDAPGKDSRRFFDAGAEAAILGGGELHLSLRREAPPDLAFLARLFPDARVVLVEGARIEGAPAVLVAGGAESETELKLPLDSVDAIVTDRPALADAAGALGVAVLAPLDAEALSLFLEAWHGRLF